MSSGYDPRKDSNHPISQYPDDPAKQGESERSYGNGRQEPWFSGESNADFQRRTNPPK